MLRLLVTCEGLGMGGACQRCSYLAHIHRNLVDALQRVGHLNVACN